jgi:hypothetical protein
VRSADSQGRALLLLSGQQQPPDGACLQHDHPQPVADDVVQLARDPLTLELDRQGCAALLLGGQLSRDPLETARVLALAARHAAREVRPSDDQCREDGVGRVARGEEHDDQDERGDARRGPRPGAERERLEQHRRERREGVLGADGQLGHSDGRSGRGQRPDRSTATEGDRHGREQREGREHSPLVGGVDSRSQPGRPSLELSVDAQCGSEDEVRSVGPPSGHGQGGPTAGASPRRRPFGGPLSSMVDTRAATRWVRAADDRREHRP